jgi:hypothetical protein
MILEAQLRCASWCVDVVPSFRSLVLVSTGNESINKKDSNFL